jgi:hypothetical protein
MPLNQRLTDLEESLDSLYETLGEAQKRLARTNDIFEKTSIKLRIRRELLPEIHELESEYWNYLTRELKVLTIEEDDASEAIVEVIQTAEIIQQSHSTQYSQEVIKLLTEIHNKLSEPGKSSSTKLKATLPLLPPFISLEMDIETESILRQIFPTFSRLLRKVGKK